MTTTQRIESLMAQRRAIIESIRHTPRTGTPVAAVREAKVRAESLMAEVARLEQRAKWEARFAS